MAQIALILRGNFFGTVPSTSYSYNEHDPSWMSCVP